MKKMKEEKKKKESEEWKVKESSKTKYPMDVDAVWFGGRHIVEVRGFLVQVQCAGVRTSMSERHTERCVTTRS